MELKNFDFQVGEHIEAMSKQIQEFKQSFCLKEDIWGVLNENITKNRTAFVPREEFASYRDTNNERINEMIEDVTESNKMMKVIDKEFKEIATNLMHKATKSDLFKVQEEMKNYCAYADLRDLYSKVVPPISKFE